MQEYENGVKRLLNALQQNIDDNNIDRLAELLNYYPKQLQEDIEGIKSVEVIRKAD
jgi:hypothetical protein